LVLKEPVASGEGQDAGSWVFQNGNFGMPDYYTIFGGYLWTWPITADQYDGLNCFMDYYTKQLPITKDSDEIIIPDADAASYYLQWKFLKKLNNGDETPGSSSCMQQYMKRRETLKSKVTKNRTFKQKPRFQNFSIQEQWDSGDPRYIRDGEFRNTGF